MKSVMLQNEISGVIEYVMGFEVVRVTKGAAPCPKVRLRTTGKRSNDGNAKIWQMTRAITVYDTEGHSLFFPEHTTGKSKVARNAQRAQVAFKNLTSGR